MLSEFRGPSRPVQDILPAAQIVGDSRRALVYPSAVQTAMDECVSWHWDDSSAADARRASAEILFATWGLPLLDAEFLSRWPRLRAVFYAAGSVKTFVTPELWARGIVVSHAAAANAVPVAEFCLATILLSLKRFWSLSQIARSARGWNPVQIENLDLKGAYGSTVGLLSLGHIGRRTLELLQHHDVKVIVHCPFLTAAQAREWKVEAVSLMELFVRSDVVSVHTPLLPETRGLVRGAHFQAMPPHATFINTARGGIVEETELIAALRARPDLTAVLDVTEPLPPRRDSPLFDLPNVVLSPHIAGSVGAEMARLGHAAVAECRRYLAGQPLQHMVSPEMLPRSA